MTTILQDYIAFFETIAPDRLHILQDLCRPEIRFVDPFNDITGLAGMRAVFEQMFEDVEEPVFKVDHVSQEKDEQAYLRWTFTARPKASKKPLCIQGVSHLTFHKDGTVVAHQDYWDPTPEIYERVPGLAFLLRILRRRLAARLPS